MQASLDMQCPVDAGTMPECDCPHEHWHIGCGVCLDVHFEDDGSCHVILDAGDFEAETTFRGLTTIDEARPLALAWGAKEIGETYP